MQKHAIALGYFFLAVFCIHVSHQTLLLSLSPMLLPVFVTAATLASFVGCTFFAAAAMPHLRTVKDCFANLIRNAKQELASDQESTHPVK
ncbi:MAG: hypothetical protein HQ518_12050 [Rhodopirellula sp.]|nr:hypothetical protein [Rhodopirellula sp.]